MNKMRTEFWLVEDRSGPTPYYACGGQWTTNPKEACWFPTQRDAQAEVDKIMRASDADVHAVLKAVLP